MRFLSLLTVSFILALTGSMKEAIAGPAKGVNNSTIVTHGGLLSVPISAADPSIDITDNLLEGLNTEYIKAKHKQQ